MDERFYRDRARILREMANDADPLIKQRLLRLATDYDRLVAVNLGPDPSTKQDKSMGRGISDP